MTQNYLCISIPEELQEFTKEVTLIDNNEDDKSGEYYYEEQVSLTAKERENYKFTGWSNGEANKTIIITIPGNITIKPTYEYNAYVITLNPNGGGVTPSEITVTKGESIGALPIPLKQFNDFAGWYTSLDFTTKVTEDLVLPFEDSIGNVPGLSVNENANAIKFFEDKELEYSSNDEIIAVYNTMIEGLNKFYSSDVLVSIEL